MPETFATTVREAMHAGCTCIGEGETVAEAARMMEQLDVGALPICGEDDRLHGMITDRDIVVKVVGRNRDPRCTLAGELAQERLIYTSVDAPIEDAMRLMREHRVRRLPVIGSDKRLCGMISEADIATHVSHEEFAALIEAIASSAPQHFSVRR
jgi:CBS domain-containing protein